MHYVDILPQWQTQFKLLVPLRTQIVVPLLQSDDGAPEFERKDCSVGDQGQGAKQSEAIFNWWGCTPYQTTTSFSTSG
jgi:hypothetical protein